MHRTSSRHHEQSTYDNPSLSQVHLYNDKSHPGKSSSKELPPVNKTKNSNNIDISEIVQNSQEDVHFRNKTLSKHESVSKSGLNMTPGLNNSQISSSNTALNASLNSTKSHGLNSNHGLGFNNGLNSSHGQHKRLPNVRKHSDNSIDSGVDGPRHEHEGSGLDTRLGSVGQARSKGYTTSGGKGILKERKTSIERLRSGLLVSIYYAVTCLQI